MIHSQYAKKIMTWLCTAAMLIPSGLASDSLPVKASVTPVPEDTVVLETDVSTPHDGCTIAGVYGSYYSQAQTALDYINQIRKNACDAGNVPDPRNPSKMLQPDDYRPLKWSSDLENIARIRAAEAGIAYGFMSSGHQRLNGQDISDITSGGISYSAENLSYYGITDMKEGIRLWYMEKQYWVNGTTDQETGHYKVLINPSVTYVGLGDFYCEEANYHNTLAGEFSYSTADLDGTMQDAPENVMQKIEVSNEWLDGYKLEGDSTLKTNQTTGVVLKHQLKRNSRTHSLWVVDPVTYESSDPEKATISKNGTVSGLRHGTTTITASIDGKVLGSTDVSVECNHTKKLVTYTEPTCIHTGLKIYHCDYCNYSPEETIPKSAHQYVYGTPDSLGKSTGVCSVCKDTIYIKPPTSLEVTWESEKDSTRGYMTSFPSHIAVGDTINCWPQVNGETDYRDVVIDSSSPTVMTPPEKVYANGPMNGVKVNSAGITTLSVYPKYNPGLKKQYTVRAGNKGSVNLALSDITLSQNAYLYNGSSCEPEVTVSYDHTVLTKGVDYTLNYENNVAAGTASVVIKGTGIFTGSKTVSFTITPLTTENHTHKEVIDAAVDASCTTPGASQGSHCSVCGAVLEARTYTDPTGHHYVNGVCSDCGDIRYIDKDNLRYTLTDNYLTGQKDLSVSAVPGKTLTGDVSVESGIMFGKATYPVNQIAKNGFADQTSLSSLTFPASIDTIQTGAFTNCTGLKKITFWSPTAPYLEAGAFKNTGTDNFTIVQPKYSVGYSPIAKESGAAMVTNSKSEAAHTMQYCTAKDPTCTESGNIAYYYCSGCNHYFTDRDGNNEIDRQGTILYPLGHDWESDFTIDIPPTTTNKGERSIHCKRCNARREVDILPVLSDNNSSSDNSAVTPSGSSSSGGTFSASQTRKTLPAKGTIFAAKGLRYKITKAGSTVSCQGPVSRKIKSASIPGSVSYRGCSYQVTAVAAKAFRKCAKLKKLRLGSHVKSIGKQAFYKCAKLQSIRLTTKVLKKKSLGKQAFTGISKKAVVSVPASKRKSYKKWFRSKGLRIR